MSTDRHSIAAKIQKLEQKIRDGDGDALTQVRLNALKKKLRTEQSDDDDGLRFLVIRHDDKGDKVLAMLTDKARALSLASRWDGQAPDDCRYRVEQWAADGSSGTVVELASPESHQ